MRREHERTVVRGPVRRARFGVRFMPGVLALALALAACSHGGPAAPASSSGSPHTPAASSGGAGGAPVANRINPCSLLTRAEVAASLGATPSAPSGKRVNGHAESIDQGYGDARLCSWNAVGTSAAGGLSFPLGLAVVQGRSGRNTVADLKATYAANPLAQSENAAPYDVPHLGDVAVANPANSEVCVLSGTVLFCVYSPASTADAVSLARDVLKRLPAS